MPFRIKVAFLDILPNQNNLVFCHETQDILYSCCDISNAEANANPLKVAEHQGER